MKSLRKELEEKLGTDKVEAHLKQVFEFSYFKPSEEDVERALRALKDK